MRSAVGLLAAAFLFGGVAASAAELTASAEDAREILFFFARFDAELGYCADKLGDAKTFADARDEWVARNSYLRDMALNLLAYLKASPNGDISGGIGCRTENRMPTMTYAGPDGWLPDGGEANSNT